MISIHCNDAIALPLLPKLKSPFVLLPAATPWKKKSGMLRYTVAEGIVFMSVQNDLALTAQPLSELTLCFFSCRIRILTSCREEEDSLSDGFE